MDSEKTSPLPKKKRRRGVNENEENEDDEEDLSGIKLTRSKSKFILDIWKTHVKRQKRGIEALITEDLSEDSSGEEYEPHSSEDESKKSVISQREDLETKLETLVDTEDLINNDVIGQRTRSKLSLSETPLETIEQAFIPPDITTDMYNTKCDNADWLNFLKDLQLPLDTIQHEDDNDPDYIAEHEQEEMDREELWAGPAAKVNKYELIELVSELFPDSPETPLEGKSIEEMGQQTSNNDLTSYNGLSKPASNDCNEQPRGESSSLEPGNEVGSNPQPNKITDIQYSILKQQLQQHVQLLLQTFLLSYGNPLIDTTFSSESVSRLSELDNLKKLYKHSFFDIINLESSLNLMKKWSDFIGASPTTQAFIKSQMRIVNDYKENKKSRYQQQLPKELIEMCLDSDAFLYPILLPARGFCDFEIVSKVKLSPSEELLLAIGLEEFSEHLDNNLNNKEDLLEIVKYVQHYLMPNRSPHYIMCKVKNILKANRPSPVKDLFDKGTIPQITHYVVKHEKLKKLRVNMADCLPDTWKEYL